MARFALDATDATPKPDVALPCFGSTINVKKAVMEDKVVKLAQDVLLEGQIGIYDSSIHGQFLGYAIRYAGQQAFFEPAETEV